MVWQQEKPNLMDWFSLESHPKMPMKVKIKAIAVQLSLLFDGFTLKQKKEKKIKHTLVQETMMTPLSQGAHDSASGTRGFVK